MNKQKPKPKHNTFIIAPKDAENYKMLMTKGNLKHNFNQWGQSTPWVGALSAGKMPAHPRLALGVTQFLSHPSWVLCRGTG